MSERPEGTPEEAPAEPIEPAEPTGAPEPELEPEWEPVVEGEDGTEVVPEAAAVAAAASSAKRRQAGAVPAGPRVPTPSERAVKITDRASSSFVIAGVAIFAAILLFGLVGGKGGFLTSTPAPPSASVGASASPSASASASASPATSSSTAPSSSAGASASPVASAAPSSAASPSPS